MSISVSQLAGRMIPAVPVPFRANAEIHASGLERYAEWMASTWRGSITSVTTGMPKCSPAA